MSTVGALIITTIQFRAVQAQFPDIRMGSIIDDRNFRGPCQTVIDAVKYALKFDKLAGLHNNLPKFVAMSSKVEGRTKLRSTTFDDQQITVALEDTLGGITVTVGKAKTCKKQDERLQHVVSIANGLKLILTCSIVKGLKRALTC